MYKAKYQIDKGEIQNISFTEDDGDTIYDVFSKLFDIDKKYLVFALFDNSRYICIDSQSKIKDIFPTDSTISIFTPLNFSYKQRNFQFPFQFNYTIEELKISIKVQIQYVKI